VFVQVDPGHSQWNVLGPMAIMWFLSSLAVPGWHVPIFSRVAVLPIVIYGAKEGVRELVDVINGRATINKWEDVWAWTKYFFEFWYFSFILIRGRTPHSNWHGEQLLAAK
jgi:hypothetical protein